MIISRGTSYRKARVDSQKRGLCFSDFNTKQKRNSSKAYLSAKYLLKADVLILKFIKRNSFASGIKGLKKGHHVKLSSNIRTLDLIFDDGIKRVGGHLHRASMALQTKHSII